MAVSKKIDHININIKNTNPSQEPPASPKAPKDKLKDMNFLCTFKIKTANIWIMGYVTISKLRSRCQTPIRNLKNSPKPISGLKGQRCSLHLQNQETWPNFLNLCIIDQWPYPNQDQDSNRESGSSSVLQSPKWRFNGHECSLHFQNH